jgi:hypothetical protein
LSKRLPLRRMLIRLLTRRRARLHPMRQWALSLVMLGVFLGLGWTSLPANLAGAQTALRLQDQQAGDSGIGIAVFVLREDGDALRFGNAEMEAPGIVRVGLYDPLDPLLSQATVAVSLPGDGRLLWLLASPEERSALRDKAAALVVSLSHSGAEIARSEPFRAEYRDRFLQILNNAVQQAWQASRTSGAWQDLLRSYQPILRQVASRDLRPIIERNFQGVALRMLKVNALGMIDPFHERPWNMEPIEQALQDSIQEVRNREIPEQTVLRMLDAPQTAAFLRIFIGVAGETLAHDTSLQDLLGQMVYDPRFRPHMEPAMDRLLDLGRTAPRLLISLHGSTDLNLVAAAAIRTTLSGRPDRVVVFMSPHQRDELMALDPSMVHSLEMLGRGGA